MGNKKQFEVQENETIDECLNRIKIEGYVPVKRIEKPIFKEVKVDSATSFEPVGRHIIFEAKRSE